MSSFVKLCQLKQSLRNWLSIVITFVLFRKKCIKNLVSSLHFPRKLNTTPLQFTDLMPERSPEVYSISSSQ